jgi:glycosyltransferase involved in cell wall biosynthesis
MKLCIVVPHFNHEVAFEAFLPTLFSLNLTCIIVDDGSERESLTHLKTLLESTKTKSYLFEHGYNRGKGAAVLTASTHARALGFTHIIQIDADGQHDVSDVEKFIALSNEHPEAIISGHPQFDKTAPKARLYGRKVTDFWVAIETLSFDIKDSLCGFRLYPLSQFEQVNDRYHIGKRMDFDTDIAVKSVWSGIDIKFIPTKVIYHQNSVSHFYYLRDNLLLIKLHVSLMLGMLIRLPLLLSRLITKRSKR